MNWTDHDNTCEEEPVSDARLGEMVVFCLVLAVLVFLWGIGQ